MSNTQPPISVLMPVYNGERYLDEAIQSIREQTFTDLEFVIVNDGSTDGSLDIIQRHAAEDTRIMVVDIPNGGIARALNKGLDHCRGRYIARMDADDVALSGRLSKQLDYLERESQVVAVGGQCEIIDGAGRVIGEIVRPSAHEQIETQFFRGGGGIMHPVAMIRADAIDKIGGYDVSLRYAQDLDFFLRLGERGQLSNLPDCCLRYRQHDGQVSIAKRIEQMDAATQAIAMAGMRRGIDVSRYVSDQYAQMSWRLRDGGERVKAVVYACRAIRMNPRNRLGYRYALSSMIPRWARMRRADTSLPAPSVPGAGVTA